MNFLRQLRSRRLLLRNGGRWHNIAWLNHVRHGLSQLTLLELVGFCLLMQLLPNLCQVLVLDLSLLNLMQLLHALVVVRVKLCAGVLEAGVVIW